MNEKGISVTELLQPSSFVFYGDPGIFVTYAEDGEAMLVGLTLIDGEWFVGIYTVQPEVEDAPAAFARTL